VEELSVLNETLAFGLVGNSVPVATMGAMLKAALKVLKHPPSVVDVDSAEAREEALVIKARLSKLKLPTAKEVVAAQKKGKEPVALRELDSKGDGGPAVLRR
jgi:hypothetical protein